MRPVYCRWLGVALIVSYAMLAFQQPDMTGQHWWEERITVLASMALFAVAVESVCLNSGVEPYQLHIAYN